MQLGRPLIRAMPSPASMTSPISSMSIVTRNCSIFRFRMEDISSGLIFSSTTCTSFFTRPFLRKNGKLTLISSCHFSLDLFKTMPNASVNHLILDLDDDATQDGLVHKDLRKTRFLVTLESSVSRRLARSSDKGTEVITSAVTFSRASWARVMKSSMMTGSFLCRPWSITILTQ